MCMLHATPHPACTDAARCRAVLVYFVLVSFAWHQYAPAHTRPQACKRTAAVYIAAEGAGAGSGRGCREREGAGSGCREGACVLSIPMRPNTTSCLQASFDESLDEMVYGDGPGLPESVQLVE